MARRDGRTFTEIRKISFVKSPQKDPHGSVLVEWGDTKVMCSAIVDEKLPQWMGNDNKGWITAEYGMLPGSTNQRMNRNRVLTTGRTQEIQRLIGRSLRGAVDMKDIGARTIQLDCDVLQADGGTRVASITGAFLALALALKRLHRDKKISNFPKLTAVAAISIGRVKGEMLTDLDYSEDSQAELDANLVMNENSEFIEIQGTAEKGSFPRKEWDQLLSQGEKALHQIIELQKKDPRRVEQVHLIICTENTGKLAEFRKLFPESWKVQSLKEIGFAKKLPPEGTTSYSENATAKAEFVGREVQKFCLGDDSGLEVAALPGELGVVSARFGGPEKLIKRMEGQKNRAARFVAVLALYDPKSKRINLFEGEVRGEITTEMRGKNGFGYDPVFIPEGFSKTLAELDEKTKNQISHRARATEKLKSALLKS